MIEKNNDHEAWLSHELTTRLRTVIANQPADCLLLSGGVDSSLLAALDVDTPAITVGLKGYGGDISKAQKVANRLGIHWYAAEIEPEEGLSLLEELIVLTKSYDPGLLNDIVTFKAAKIATSNGWRTLRTGDAADTLFVGYSYLNNPELFNQYLVNLLPHIRLSPTTIGERMNIRFVYPYLHPTIYNFAAGISYDKHTEVLESSEAADFHLRELSENKSTKLWGKIILRKAAQRYLPVDIAWRTKADLEYGSGTYILEDILAKSVTEQDIKDIKLSSKHFWNKMHAKLYLKFMEKGLVIPAVDQNEYGCNWCRGGVSIGRNHCSTCGAFPASQCPGELFANERDRI